MLPESNRSNGAADLSVHSADDNPVQATQILSAALPAVTNAFQVIHHAARKRAVARRIALPGSYLGFSDEQGEQQLLPIDADTVRIGRSSSADIQLEDIRVSRKHAIIARTGTEVRILDDGSSTGTFVNDQATVTTELHDGDVIRLGPVEFTFVVVR